MQRDDIPGLLRRLRQARGLTQEELAREIGVAYSTVNLWENGKRRPQPFLARAIRRLASEARVAGPDDRSDSEGAADA